MSDPLMRKTEQHYDCKQVNKYLLKENDCKFNCRWQIFISK